MKISKTYSEQLEKEVEKRSYELKEAQKISAKIAWQASGNLAGSISHEFAHIRWA